MPGIAAPPGCALDRWGRGRHHSESARLRSLHASFSLWESRAAAGRAGSLVETGQPGVEHDAVTHHPHVPHAVSALGSIGHVCRMQTTTDFVSTYLPMTRLQIVLHRDAHLSGSTCAPLQLHTKYAVHHLVHRKLHVQYFCAHGEQDAERTPPSDNS